MTGNHKDRNIIITTERHRIIRNKPNNSRQRRIQGNNRKYQKRHRDYKTIRRMMTNNRGKQK